MPFLARITIYPIKSLDGLDLQHSTVLPSGALEHDRRFALLDAAGNLINGKSDPRICTIGTRYNLAAQTVTLWRRPSGAARETFSLAADNQPLLHWFSAQFEQLVSLIEDRDKGWPDDPRAPGPTVVSTASYEAISGWYPGLSPQQLRRRFRANLELDDVPAFWEDGLYTETESVCFALGDLLLEGTNPCQRCVVPTRDPDDGQALPQFAKTFAERRQRSLPNWAAAPRFDHFYRLATNTRRAEPAQRCVIRVGDELRLHGPVSPPEELE